MNIRRCHHRKKYASYIFVVCATILLMFKLSLPSTTIPITCQYTVTFNRTTINHYNSHMDEHFKFPDVNESVILNGAEKNIGQMRSLYFLHESTVHELATQNISGSSIYLYFQPAISQVEREVMLVLLQNLVRACSKFNVTFFLYGGSLLGSWRHHDIIPWDDDVDVMVNSSHRNRLKFALSNLGDHFALYSPRGERWKFYWTKPSTLPHKPYRWPYIDIFFFLENDTYIFDESLDYRQAFSYPKHHVFPLAFRPFAGGMLPVPFKCQHVVEKNYSPSLCTSPTFSHKLESYTPKHLRITVPCKRLYNLYHFIHRRTEGNVVLEELCDGKQVIRTFGYPKNCC